ncbi:hypothetical protein MMC16_006393 [Acarospora aff. strigata]|nr:hypothetical protein [Acarospora aff. strigata]
MNWTGIVEKLDEEGSSSTLARPVRDALRRAATELAKRCLTDVERASGLDPASLVNIDAIVFMARHYAERNRVAHQDVFDYTMAGDLASLRSLFDHVDNCLRDLLGGERAEFSEVEEYKTALAVVKRLIWRYDENTQEWIPTAHGDEIMSRQPRGDSAPAKTDQSSRNVKANRTLPTCAVCGQSQPQAVIDAAFSPHEALDAVLIPGLLEQCTGVTTPTLDRAGGLSDPIKRGTKRPSAPDGVLPLAKRSKVNREVLQARLLEEKRTLCANTLRKCGTVVKGIVTDDKDLEKAQKLAEILLGNLRGIAGVDPSEG